MTAPKYFVQPFANSGDKVAIPETVQPDGSVSYPQGYGPDYSLDPATNPAALNIERTKMNEALFDITNAIQYVQQHGVSAWISSADNGGSPYSYSTYDRVRYTDNVVYVSLVDANTATPGTDPTKWAVASNGGISSTLTAAHILVGNASNVATDVPMSGEAAISNAGAVTLLNSAVIGKVLTGYVSGAGTVASSDSILQAIQKLNGNVAAIPTSVFSSSFVSSEQTVNVASNIVVSHGLGVVPKSYQIVLRCKTTELNYSVGDEVDITSSGYFNGATNSETTAYANSTQIGIANRTSYGIVDKLTFAETVITPANWKFVFKAYA